MAFTVRATAISPKPFNVGKIRSNTARVLMDEGKQDRATLNKTVQGWKGETPAMVYEVSITDKEASVWIGPKGSESSVEKWRRIDEPGRAVEHPITPRTKEYLRFPYMGKPRMSYRPKTTPKKFSSSGPGERLGPYIKTKHVNHPGIYEPREWSITLANQRIKPFADNVQEAINRGLEP